MSLREVAMRLKINPPAVILTLQDRSIFTPEEDKCWRTQDNLNGAEDKLL